MRVILDVRCTECGNVDEVLGQHDAEFNCSVCGGTARKIISTVRCSLEGVSGDFPGAAMKWTRQHEQGAKKGG